MAFCVFFQKSPDIGLCWRRFIVMPGRSPSSNWELYFSSSNSPRFIKFLAHSPLQPTDFVWTLYFPLKVSKTNFCYFSFEQLISYRLLSNLLNSFQFSYNPDCSWESTSPSSAKLFLPYILYPLPPTKPPQNFLVVLLQFKNLQYGRQLNFSEVLG